MEFDIQPKSLMFVIHVPAGQVNRLAKTLHTQKFFPPDHLVAEVKNGDGEGKLFWISGKTLASPQTAAEFLAGIEGVTSFQTAGRSEVLESLKNMKRIIQPPLWHRCLKAVISFLQ